MADIQIIIPMSGLGKRFIAAGYTDPKPLIKVDEFPIIKHVIDLFPGETDITFICNKIHIQNSKMKNILLKISPTAKIYEIDTAKGPVDAIKHIYEFIENEKKVIISYCDYGTVWNYDTFLKYIEQNNCDGCIAYYTGFHPHMLGKDDYAYIKHIEDRALQIREKRKFLENKMEEYTSNGTYYFKSGKILKYYFDKLLNSNETINGEYYVSMVYNYLIEDSLVVNLFEIERMLQWGTPYDLESYKFWQNYFNVKNKINTKVYKNVTTILPMAGKGNRFKMNGYNLPKPFLPIDGIPMIIKAIKSLPQSENNIFICLEEYKSYNIEKIIQSEYPNSKIIFIKDTTNGQACTCEIGITETNLDLEMPILISACDNGVYYDSIEYDKLLNDETIDIIVWSFRNNLASLNNPNAYAWLSIDENNFITNVSCKKFPFENPLIEHAIIGTMFFRKAKYFVDGLQKNYIDTVTTNGEYYVDDVINQNIKMGLKVKVFEANYICWGTPNDYKTYEYWKKHFSND